MDKTFKIYTVGKMKGVPIEEQMSWRTELETKLCGVRRFDEVTFIHPPDYYCYEENYQQSEREIKQWELSQVRSSDILVVNLDGINDSVGAHFELAAADAVNGAGNKYIYVIGVGKSKEPLHPWIEDCLLRQEDTIDDAVEYITKYIMM